VRSPAPTGAEGKDVDELIKALGPEKDPDAREAADEAQGKIGDPRAVDPLTAALKDPKDDARKEAEKALARLR
jgi:HEAT repeat protein